MFLKFSSCFCVSHGMNAFEKASDDQPDSVLDSGQCTESNGSEIAMMFLPVNRISFKNLNAVAERGISSAASSEVGG